MPGIKEIGEIFDYTPIHQAILLEGIHGIGKSEFITERFEALGYKVVTMFLGQTSDAGDIIGLPNRKTIKIKYDGEEIDQVITEFAPPKWWPFGVDDKLVIFFDEFNRGKPEVYQCIMDMVLNRKLNGFNLPKQTRIIAAMNPNGEEYDYDVTILDRALLDRFNKYEFYPTTEEWISWAVSHNIDNDIIGYISKNSTDLDPPKSISEDLLNEVHPSRRSWARVSEIIKDNPDIISKENKIFETMLYGIIGRAVTGKFITYMKNSRNGINPGTIVTRWSDDVKGRVLNMGNTEISTLNRELGKWFDEQYDSISMSAEKELRKYAKNVGEYLATVPNELSVDFLDYILQSQNSGKKWGNYLLSYNDSIVDLYCSKLKAK